ncbi:hypothetical protein CYMTET_12113 [Cymbomonas tetramitiformis]|uniref:Uncharacterized protein n=1 Tax=Cymbomonas tetramitiformis TaxID=36881 RepID=A0AAE0GL16_9CHLO|nr:hypothetical protein CYMTET_12113 [Cymbomonas tetramitiformis]
MLSKDKGQVEASGSARARGLVKSKIQNLDSTSPGGINGCRVAVSEPRNATKEFQAYVASGAAVYRVHVSVPVPEVRVGKGNLLLPTPTTNARSEILPFLPFRSEVQSLALMESPDGQALLGGVDCYGRALVGKLNASSGGCSGSYQLNPPYIDGGSGEDGWAAMAFAAPHLSMIALARHYPRSIDIYDAGLHVRTMHTPHAPTAIAFMPPAGTASQDAPPSMPILITEFNQVSIWDLRASERAGRVQSVVVDWTGSRLLALATTFGSQERVVAAGGSDRTVSIIDPRKWTVRIKCRGALKYTITSLHFSTYTANTCFIGGLDNGVLCADLQHGRVHRHGPNNSLTPQFAFRGDSRWLGVHKARSRDLLIGFGENSSLFVLDAQQAGGQQATVTAGSPILFGAETTGSGRASGPTSSRTLPQSSQANSGAQ